MGKTADLPMVQKTIIDTLHKESKLQRVITERAVQEVLYQSILNAKLTARKKLGRKMCTSNRDDRKLENILTSIPRERRAGWATDGNDDLLRTAD